MAQGSETATFRVNIEGNAADKAAQAADAMDQMRKSVSAGRASLREMSGALKNLTGDSDEVKAAQQSLKSAIDAEKASVSANTLEMLKAKKAYGDAGGDVKKLAAEKSKLADKVKGEKDAQKKLSEELKKTQADQAAAKAKALGAAISTAGGPVASLRDKLATLKDVMGEGGAGGASTLLTLGMAGLATAAVALVAAVGAAVYALGRFVLKGADAARSAGLLREAAMGGNAQWGKNFGEQVDALAARVPTSKERIDELGRSLAKSRIGGQVWVDTLNAVTQASAALGDDAGNKLKEFVERGRLVGRMQINPQEMIGSGVDFQDVAKALSISMKVGVKEAQAALFEGRVKLADGAKALRNAVEAKFGSINLRQMVSLENLAKKLGETFDSLTKNVDIEPLLKGLKEMADVFSVSTVSGQALKQMVEVFGKDMVGAFGSTTPVAKKFVYGLIIGAQELMIGYLQVRTALRSAFSDTKIITSAEAVKLAAGGVQLAFVGAGLAVGALALGLAPFVYVGVKVIEVFNGIKDATNAYRDFIVGTDWKATGLAIVEGIANGIMSGTTLIRDAVVGMAQTVKQTFTGKLKIQSPSKVFKEYGENTTEGYAEGIESGTGGAQASVNAMVSTPSSGGGRAGAPINLTININASGPNAQAVAAAVASSSVLDQLTAAVIDAVHGSGAGVPA